MLVWVALVAVAAALGALLSPLAAAGGAGAASLLLLFLGRRPPPVMAPSVPRLPTPGPGTDLGARDAEAQALIARVSDALLILDAERAVVLANPAAQLLLAPDGGAVVGQSLIRAGWSDELANVVAAATGLPQELAFSGGRTLLATAFPLPGDRGETGLILTEVSAARRAERSRSELVANLSHELRTPIAAARALAETLEGGVDDRERRERYERQLLAELDRLTAIVERTLRLSRIEAGAEALELASQDVASLLGTAAQRVGTLLEASALELRVTEAPDTPAVLADFDRVTEVLTILLDNAVKFSPAGEPISVRAWAGDDPGFVTFEVSDRGPGVLPSERARVFERLYTGDPARATRAGDRQGFGLGLAIARHIIARHGGRIWIEDAPGAGAVFRFTLPVAHAGR